MQTGSLDVGSPLKTGSLNVGSPLKMLPVFSSTGTAALPMDAGVRLTEERPNDLSSLMAELPSRAVTTTVLNSGGKGSNASVLLAELPSDAVTTTVLNSAVSLSNASGLTAEPPSFVGSPEVLNSVVNGSNMNGHNDVDHYGQYRDDADHYGHYHSSMQDQDQGVHVVGDRIEHHDSGMHHHDQGAHVVGDHIEHHDSSIHHQDEGVRISVEHVGHHHDDGLHGNGSPQPYSVQEHGVGQHISTSLVEGRSERVDSGTSHLSQSVEQHIVTNIGTKIRIYRRTPRVKRVQETVLVPELSHEMRPIVLTKNRVVMVDVEEVEMVPIIKEVKKMKRIIVHKIREERRNQTCSEPVIEYVRRGTMVRVPRVVKVEEDVEFKVPVMKRVQEKVRVEVPTGEWIERPVVPDSNVSKVLNNAKVEAVLARSKYVDFVILRQDWMRGHSVALIAANQAALERWATDFGVGYSDFAELCSKREARMEVLASLIQVAKEGALESFEIPRKVRLYRGDMLKALLTVMQTTEFSTHVETSTNWDNRDVKLGKVEAVLVRSKYVDFVMLRRDSIRGRSVALIAANQAALERWAKVSGVDYSDFAELCAKPEARKEVLASLMQVAKEGALEGSEIPAKVRLYRGDVLKAFLLVAETTKLNPHSDTPATYWEIRDVEKLVKYRTREYVEYAKHGKVEAVLVRSKYVDFVMLRLDSVRGHCVALVAANEAALLRWAKESGTVCTDFSELCAKPEARKEVLASLVQVAKEGALDSSEIPTKVILYRGEVLNAFLTVSWTATFNPYLNSRVIHGGTGHMNGLRPGWGWGFENSGRPSKGNTSKNARVEAVLVKSKFVDSVILRQDPISGHSVALIAANQAALERWAADSGVGYSDFAELCSKPEARKEVLDSLIEVARESGLEIFEIPRKVRLYRGDMLKALLTVVQTTEFNTHVETSTNWDNRDVKLGKVEAVLVRSKYVDFVMLRRDSIRGRSVALIAANQAALERWAKVSGVDYSDFAELCAKPEARKEVLASLMQVAKEGALEGSEIPAKVRLYRGDVLKAFLLVAETTKLNPHSDTPATYWEIRDVEKLVKYRTREYVEYAKHGKVEAVLVRSKYVDFVMLRLDSVRGHCVALVAANEAALLRWAKESGTVCTDFSELCAKPEARKEVLASLVQVAKEGALDSSEIPTKVILYRGEVLKAFLTITRTTKLNSHLKTPASGEESLDLKESQGDAMLGKVELVLRRSPYVDSVMLRLDSVRGHCVALVAANQAALERWAKNAGVRYSDFAELCLKAEARKEVLDSLVQVAREGQYEGFKIPSEVALLADRDDMVTAAVMLTHMRRNHRIASTAPINVATSPVHLSNEAVHLGSGPALVINDEVRKGELVTPVQTINEVVSRGTGAGTVTPVKIIKEEMYLGKGSEIGTPFETINEARYGGKAVDNGTLVQIVNGAVYDGKGVEFVPPQGGEYGLLRKVEAVLKCSPYVDYVMVHPDPIFGHYVAQVVADQAVLERWAKGSGVGYSDFADLCSKIEARKEVLTSIMEVAREGGLERFEIPTEVALVAEHGDLVTVALRGTQKTTLKDRADDFYSRFLNLTVQEKGSRDVNVLDKVFHAVNMQADKYTSLGKVEEVVVRSPYVDSVMLHLDPLHGHCVALVVGNRDALEDWAKSDNVDYSGFTDLVSKPETRKKVLASVIQVAREGGLESFEIPKKIALLADRGDLLNVAAMLTHMTRLKQREGNLNMRFLELRVHDKESRDVEVLDKVLDAVCVEAGEYGRLGKVEEVLERSPYGDNVLLHLDPIHGRCVALVLVNAAALEDWAKSTSVEYSDFADLCSKLEARKEVLTSLIQVAREGELERFEIPMEVTLLAAGDDLVTAAITRREGPVMTEGQVDLLDEEWRTGSVLAGWVHQQNVVHE